ncbi:MAG: hypothetical protein OER56_03830 [Hyphomicrobiales bacterium]|nr:hypothetical protein [Hyphomicrobiales bacterium]
MSSSIRNLVIAALAAIIGYSIEVTAEPVSQYSSIAPEKCRQLTADEESGSVTFSCPGLAGIDVWVGEGDLRTFLAYGPEPRKQCAAQQTFGSFNTAGPTMEWRMEDGRPFATIIRYKMDSDGKRFNFLVVTTLRGGQACHMGYVDGALPRHNELARDIADSQARQFNCATDTPVMMTDRDYQLSHLLSGVPCGPDAAMKFQE